MRLFADASVKAGIVRALRSRGVEVIYGLEGDHGAPDPVVLASASVQGLVLLTEDTDFGELVFRDRAASVGVILIRFDVTTEPGAMIAATRVIDALATAEGGFTTLTEEHVRRRVLPSLTLRLAFALRAARLGFHKSGGSHAPRCHRLLCSHRSREIGARWFQRHAWRGDGGACDPARGCARQA